MKLRKYKDGAYIFILIGIVLLLMLLYELIHIGFDINNSGFILCGILMIFCFFFGIRNLSKRTKVKNLRQELTQHGKRVKARVLIILSIPSKSNRGNKYKIVAKYMKETFCSEDYSIGIDEIIEKGDNIDVYIDENDHSKYWMDVDTLFKEKSEMMEAQYGK